MRWILAMTVALGLSGCCTQVGCSDGVGIDLLGPMDPGVYTFEITADGDTWTCTYELDAEFPCDDDSFVWLAELSDDGWTLGVRGGTPKTVDVRLSLDGDVLVETTLEPVYETFSPNGERCGPTCTSAYEKIEF